MSRAPVQPPLEQLGRAEALVAEMLRAGRAPVLALGVVPLAELGGVRVAVFGEAGGVDAPAWEGWLPEAEALELVARHPGLRRATWDAELGQAWTVAWTEDDGDLVVWTATQARLRVQGGTLDVLEAGRWNIVPAARIARVSLAPGGPEHGLMRLHTTDGRMVTMRAGRLVAASLACRRVAEVLGVTLATSRWEG